MDKSAPTCPKCDQEMEPGDAIEAVALDTDMTCPNCSAEVHVTAVPHYTYNTCVSTEVLEVYVVHATYIDYDQTTSWVVAVFEELSEANNYAQECLNAFLATVKDAERADFDLYATHEPEVAAFTQRQRISRLDPNVVDEELLGTGVSVLGSFSDRRTLEYVVVPATYTPASPS